MSSRNTVPVDFSGPVFPNPTGIKPVSDDDIHPDVTPISGDATMSAGVYRPPRVTRLPKGMLVPGNIDLNQRPVVQNDDGTHSSEYSVSYQDEQGHEVLIPTVVDGKFFTPDGKKPPVGSAAEKQMIQRAISYSRGMNQHLGVFDSPKNADVYAALVHKTPRDKNREPLYIVPGPPAKRPTKANNPILDVLDAYDDVPNRQNFLKTAYPGKPPGKLDNESEAELPDEPRFKSHVETTHEEVAAEEAEKESKSKPKK